mgnify:FL=1
MRKIFNRICATILTACCILTCSNVTFASAFNNSSLITSNSEISSVYKEGFSETVLLEETAYTYNGYINNFGHRVIEITSNNNKNIDTLVFDDNTGTVYLNNSIIATYTVDDANISSVVPFSSGWSPADSGSKYISWAEGAAVAVVAGVVAGCLGGTVGAVLGGVSAFAGLCSGGTLSWKKWYKVEGTKARLKTDWTFKAPTGTSYGPYTYTISR